MIIFKERSSAGALTNSLTVSRPSGIILEGDLLVAHIIADNHTSSRETITRYPSGWEKLEDTKGVNYNSHAVLYKVATSNEPASYVFDFDFKDEFAVNIGHFSTDSGQPTKLGIKTSYSRPDAGSSVSISLDMDFLYVSFFTTHSSSTMSIPSGMSMTWNTRIVSYTYSSAGHKWMSGGGTTGISSVSNADKCISIAIVTMNQPPTQPGDITGIQESLYVAGESIKLSWGASTDQEGDSITYDIDVYNGSSWVPVATNISDISIPIVVPSNINTANAKIRVQAKDTIGNKSPYKESQNFSIYDKMLLIRDGDTVKSYKNGIWKII
ncbi:TPA: hypothetical protein ROY08_001261 [Bacillus cereus]|nr:hypothetical protein [Bacillus cereus]